MTERSDVLRVAAVQFRFRATSSFSEFAEHLRYWVQVASDYRAEVVVFPEFVSAELLTLPEHRGKTGRHAFEALAGHAEAVSALMAELSVEYFVPIVAGSQPILAGDSLKNVSTIHLPSGEKFEQAKLHITPSEIDSYGVVGGDSIGAFSVGKTRAGILVCYDSEFPEAARALADDGAEVLFVPYCTDNREGHLRVRYCSQARAIENQAYVVTAGVTGNLTHVSGLDVHYAKSAIFTPSDVGFARDGILREAEANDEAVVVADLDLAALRENRKSGTVRPLADRRRDLFGDG